MSTNHNICTPITNLQQLVRHMQPVLNDGVYVYASVPLDSNTQALGVIASIREVEGMTIILPEDVALKAKLDVLLRVAWISLNVQSDLQAIGFTAAFSTALAEAGIGCNVIAGAFHDHVFVPIEASAEAIATLNRLAQQA